MAILCFCPPLTRPPPTPTSESYPSGIAEMNPCALAIFAASTTSSRVAAAAFPAAMFSCTLPLNSVGSCSTMPICVLSHIGSRSRRSTPSTVTHPAAGSLAPSMRIDDKSSLASFFAASFAADRVVGS